MTLRISPHAIEQDQGPFIFPGILVGSGPGLPSAPDGTLHVWSGSAGAVTAHANADDLVVENNSMGGISILVPDVTWANIYFGQGAVNNSGFIRYGGVTHQLEFGINQATIAAWLPGQVFFVGNPFSIFTTGVMALEAVIEIVVNDRGFDVDFRVEAVGVANALFVQGSDGFVGVGIALPTGRLHSYDGASGATANAEARTIIAEHSNHTGISILTPNTKYSMLGFGDPENALAGTIIYDHAANIGTADSMYFRTNAGYRVTITATGKVGIHPGGYVAPDGTLHVHTATAGVVTAHAGADDLIVENSGTVGMSFLFPNNQAGVIMFGDVADNYYHSIEAFGSAHATLAGNVLHFVGNTYMMRLTSTGVTIGPGAEGIAPEATLHVYRSSAGAVTPHADADEIIFEKNAHSGISGLAPDNAIVRYIAGFPGDNDYHGFLFIGPTHASHAGLIQHRVAGGTRLTMSATEMKSEIPLKIKEAAAAVADTAGYGQFWVRSDAPCTPWFTDDTGLDWQLLGPQLESDDVIENSAGAYQTLCTLPGNHYGSVYVYGSENGFNNVGAYRVDFVDGVTTAITVATLGEIGGTAGHLTFQLNGQDLEARGQHAVAPPARVRYHVFSRIMVL